MAFELLFPETALPLYEYARLVGYSECAFFGVSSPDNGAFACREIWSFDQRLSVAYSLAEAQDYLEETLRYHMRPTWDTAESHPYSNPFLTKWNKVIALGKKVETLVEAGSIVDHTNDPAEITVPYAGTSTDGIVIYYPNSPDRIYPSSITLAGGNLTILIPRCRMVAYTNLENPEQGWDYNDTSLFQDTVDVYDVSTDNTDQITMYTNHSCTTSCPDVCTEASSTGCGIITDPDIGKVSVTDATYSLRSWTRSTCNRPYYRMTVNYLSGLTSLNPADKSALMRLAHALMPNEPCGCSVTQNLWKRDRNIPQIMTAERLNCEYGLNDGAWFAWKYANKKASIRIGVI